MSEARFKLLETREPVLIPGRSTRTKTFTADGGYRIDLQPVAGVMAFVIQAHDAATIVPVHSVAYWTMERSAIVEASPADTAAVQKGKAGK